MNGAGGSNTTWDYKPRAVDEGLRIGLMWPTSPTSSILSKAVADRNPDILNASYHMKLATMVESIGFDFAFFADYYVPHGADNTRIGHGDPGIMAPLWAVPVILSTSRLGVITSLHTTYMHPALIARIGANLDAMSGGRWGWNIVTGYRAVEARLFGLDDLLDHDARYEMGYEAVDAVQQLWNARAPLAYEGKYYKFSGYVKGPYPAQPGGPLLVNAGISPAGKAFSSAVCDYAFFTVSDLAETAPVVASLQELAGQAGREPGSMRALCGVTVIMGETRAEAEEKQQWMESTLDWQAAENHLMNLLGGAQTFRARFTGVEREQQIRSIGLGAGGCQIVGTAADVAEQLIDAHRNGGLRGITVSSPLWAIEQIRLFAGVFPLLEKAGVWSRPEQRAWSW